MNLNKKNIVFDLNIVAMMLTFLIICSKITIPLSFIPITLQTLAVFIIPLILGSKRSFIVFLLYIILGLIGLPIFSKGGGISYIYEPSFGFILGFMVCSPIIGKCGSINKYKNVILLTISIIVLYSIGLFYMGIILNYYLKLNKDIISIIKIGFLPFILKDIISVIIAKIVSKRLNSIIN